MRLVLRMIIYGLISLIYIYLLTEAEFSGELAKILFHSLSIGAFVGSIGLFVFSNTNNIAMAFLSSIALLLAQWFFPKNRGEALMLFTMPEIRVRKMLLIFGLSFIVLLLSMSIWKRESIS